MMSLLRNRNPWRRASVDLRVTATAVAILQHVEAMRIHAVRDQCLSCGAKVIQSAAYWVGFVPEKHRKDPEWVHRHIEMPGARKAARQLDEERAVQSDPDDPMDPRNWAP